MIDPRLLNHGYFITKLELPQSIFDIVKERNWQELDRQFLIQTQPTGSLFQELRNYLNFQSIEYIISLREAQDQHQVDGIWHDDGSRLLAFSLSLTIDPVEGGILEFRQKNKNTPKLIETPKYGDMIVFLTGVHGYEHKINQVTKGSRLVIAGWCT
jgi:hypothetical protein